MMQGKKVDVNLCKCERCDHEWESRSTPVVCPNPKCHSPYWNKPKVRKPKVKKAKWLGKK